MARDAIDKKTKALRDSNAKAYPRGGTQYDYRESEITRMRDAALLSLVAYKEGGMANFTGPAWLDGTPQHPEAVLNPVQTELFKEFVASMQRISISVPGMMAFGGEIGGGLAGNTFTGDIIVNVDSLNSDTDYDAVGEKIMQSIMNKMNAGSVVGGIRYSR